MVTFYDHFGVKQEYFAAKTEKMLLGRIAGVLSLTFIPYALSVKQLRFDAMLRPAVVSKL
jgi:hypothetical protein